MDTSGDMQKRQTLDFQVKIFYHEIVQCADPRKRYDGNKMKMIILDEERELIKKQMNRKRYRRLIHTINRANRERRKWYRNYHNELLLHTMLTGMLS